MRAPTWVANTLLAYGRTLRARGAARTSRRHPRCSPRPRRSPSAQGCRRCSRAPRELGAVAAPAAPPPDELSSREVDVLRLVATGASNREIGEQLFISGHTVANHVRSILRKTGAANRTEAAGYAYRHALIDPGDPR